VTENADSQIGLHGRRFSDVKRFANVSVVASKPQRRSSGRTSRSSSVVAREQDWTALAPVLLLAHC
jgi:hypothetical protein